jgi:hypothetical protein
VKDPSRNFPVPTVPGMALGCTSDHEHFPSQVGSIGGSL